MKEQVIKLLELDISREADKITSFWKNISVEKYSLPSRFILTGDTFNAIVSEKIIVELNDIILSLDSLINSSSEAIIELLISYKEKYESILIRACIKRKEDSILGQEVRQAYYLALTNIIKKIERWTRRINNDTTNTELKEKTTPITVNFFAHESIEILLSNSELAELKEDEELSVDAIDISDELIHQKHPTVESWELNPNQPYRLTE